jgi:HEAT repeat protein
MTENLSRDNRIKDIKYILKDLLKVIKVVSLYPETNPLPTSMKRSFAERLVSLVEQYGQIAISVEKDVLMYEQEVVFEDHSKEESLAALFFDNGITDFTFKDGLEVEDVYKLLDALKEYLNAPGKSQDLVSLIWEAGINGFTFSTLEDVVFSEYNENFNLQQYMQTRTAAGSDQKQFSTDEIKTYQAIFDLERESNVVTLEDEDDSTQAQSMRQADGQSSQALFYAVMPARDQATIFDGQGIDNTALRTAEAAKAMGLDDIQPRRVPVPDTTLILNEEFKLSHEEEESVCKILSEDAEFDLFESTLELLKEMLHQEVEMNGFYETVTICERILSEYLHAGKLEHAAQLLHYLKELEDAIRADKPLWSERLKDALVTAGSKERLQALTTGLNNHPEIGADELSHYLENFSWEALGNLTDLLGELNHRRHREALCDFLARQGKRHPDIVAKGIYDKRWYVVRNTVIILARIGDDIALKHLKHALKHEERRVRLELVKALRDCPNEKALELFREAVMDSDREIRDLAIDAIVARGGPAAFEIITELINDDGFVLLDQSEQQVLLKAFSMLGGDAAVGYLAQLILKRNPLRNSLLSFYRRAAFEALCYNRGEKAERLLVKLSSSWRPDIRRRASAALHRRREIIYGGN